ncbi:Rne/Rng family ribonuclease [Microvenator marinus]|uniref:Rne/Rng family ribonuclease n=1 Tax=Microvenator marinus TaxID=2600177 RepID=A0A5B8XND2_9DELT|nr:Rne/Rng family ribonuclease [Microvenator marinus]QED27362.1 Rne/Rng family ribonuclease [Microvenator marinus]
MSNVLVVNSTSDETRVALIEHGIISEFHIERKRERGIVGNIYKGKSVRVLPGMQAAFVDISHERAGFLHASDVYNFEEDFAVYEDDSDRQLARGRGRQRTEIQDSLDSGQEILVQVAKEPMGTKGARLTSHISLPGRYVVFMPTVSHVGISKRIESDRDRRRLRKIVEAHRPEGTGFIVRTVSAGVSEEELVHDMKSLIALWGEVLEKHARVKAPYLLYEESDLIIRAVRDLVGVHLDAIVLDNVQDKERVEQFVEKYIPNFSGEIKLFTEPEPIFDAYGIESEIRSALHRRVDLKSGGSLVIDRAEALTAIDVNTGKFVGKTTSHEETILRTNLEAVDEVVYQLKLRNIGGIIIIDFIDMEEVKHRDRVYRALEEALKRDRATTNALAISEFGLVEMTRKRTRESIDQYLCESCPVCDGAGVVKSRESAAYDVIRQIQRVGRRYTEPNLQVEANPAVIEYLRGPEKKAVKELEDTFGKSIKFKSLQNWGMDQFKVSGIK